MSLYLRLLRFWHKNRKILFMREIWHRFWDAPDWYIFSFPYCNRLRCPENNTAKMECKIPEKRKTIGEIFFSVGEGMTCPLRLFRSHRDKEKEKERFLKV